MESDVLALLLDWARSRYFGKYRGEVVANADDTRRGRLKVKVPAVLGTLEVWAMPCVPYAGKDVGLFAMPPEKSGVWIEFEGGDPSFPIWVGCFWADGEAPEQGDPAKKVWKTDQHRLVIDDQAGDVRLETGDAASVHLKDHVTTSAGGAKQVIDRRGVASTSAGTGKLEVTAGSVKVNGGALEVT